MVYVYAEVAGRTPAEVISRSSTRTIGTAGDDQGADPRPGGADLP
ncbi:MAG: hypothetical protein U5R48_09010 [Gammaproteobacteria bacterium]|nr:hypothetical protein [Gammaproteobacteria bacterium]